MEREDVDRLIFVGIIAAVVIAVTAGFTVYWTVVDTLAIDAGLVQQPHPKGGTYWTRQNPTTQE